jgi:hypothetical protein
MDSKHSNIFLEGQYLGVRKYYGYFINLYLWKDEFYEVSYHIDSNEISKIEKLDDDKKLNLYIDYMNKIDKHENA